MALDPALLEILRCPDEHHAVLEYDAAVQTLTCTECRRVFEIRDGIPILLLDDARLPGEDDSPGTADPAGDGAAGAGAAGLAGDEAAAGDAR